MIQRSSRREFLSLLSAFVAAGIIPRESLSDTSGICVYDLGATKVRGNVAVLSDVEVPNGALIVVAVYDESANGPGVMSDSSSNAYSLAMSSDNCFLYYTANARQPGDITYTKSQRSSGGLGLSALYATGVACLDTTVVKKRESNSVTA